MTQDVGERRRRWVVAKNKIYNRYKVGDGKVVLVRKGVTREALSGRKSKALSKAYNDNKVSNEKDETFIGKWFVCSKPTV